MTSPPRLTLAVIAWRQAGVIEAAVHSALQQQGEPIEVLLSDDCSPDDTFDRMRAVAAAYRGPHQVRLRRNDTNAGIGAHINQVFAAARGELVIVMAGDDLALPQRAERVAAAWDASGRRADLVASDVIDMSHDGHDLGVLKVDDLSQWRSLDDWLRRRPYVVGAGHAVTRRLVQRFGPLRPDVMHEDQANVLRAVLAGGAVTVAEPLVRYRRGGVSDGPADDTASALLQWMRRQSQKHAALHDQWLADARHAGAEDRLWPAIAPDWHRQRYLLQLLQADGALARLRTAVFNEAPLPLAWRLRKVAQLLWPAAAAHWRAAQARRRAARRQGRR